MSRKKPIGFYTDEKGRKRPIYSESEFLERYLMLRADLDLINRRIRELANEIVVLQDMMRDPNEDHEYLRHLIREKSEEMRELQNERALIMQSLRLTRE